MRISRRTALAGVAAAGAATLASWRAMRTEDAPPPEWTPQMSSPASSESGMRRRDFGATGMKVSEVGFGAWAIGGQAYGSVARDESLRALARAEELGCNYVDTAMVYGDSELLLGDFLQGRRSRWLVATKYSAQPEGMTRTLEIQLQRLRTDYVDFYQIHWAPGRDEQALYEELYGLKKAGKARAVGISLKSARDIDHVLDDTAVDGFMVRCSLLDPEPFVSRLHRLRSKRLAVVIRSALKEGFLTGKYTREATFPDPNDQRHTWTREQIAQTVEAVERFRFLEAEAGTMVTAAARYPLSFPEVATVVLGTKSFAQASSNFGLVSARTLSPAALARIRDTQIELGLRSRRELLMERVRGLLAG